jgi:hypothetical protein
MVAQPPEAESPLARESLAGRWGGHLREPGAANHIVGRILSMGVPILNSFAAGELYTSPPSSHLQAVHRKPS